MEVNFTIVTGAHPIPGKPLNGVLPRSFALWSAIVYLGLFIIRPWEVLIPSLQIIHFERTYAILMILIVLFFRGFHWSWNLQNISVSLFTLTLGLSSIMARDPASAWDAYYRFLTQIVCYLVLISVIRELYDLVFIVLAYIGFMELYLTKALWEYFIYGRHVFQQGVTRLVGIEDTYGNHNALACSIAISLPLWLLLWRRRAEIYDGWSPFWRHLFIIAIAVYPAIGGIGVLLTNSRTGALCLLLFLLWAGWERGSFAKSLKKIAIVILLIITVWIVMPLEQKHRISTIWDPSEGPAIADESKMGRLVGFFAGLHIFYRFPLLGVGPGNFIQTRLTLIDDSPFDAHNLPGQMLAETGFLGALSFCFLVFAIIYNNRKTQQIASHHNHPHLAIVRDLASSCQGSLLVLFCEGIGSHNFYRFNWLWLAVFCSFSFRFAKELITDNIN